MQREPNCLQVKNIKFQYIRRLELKKVKSDAALLAHKQQSPMADKHSSAFQTLPASEYLVIKAVSPTTKTMARCCSAKSAKGKSGQPQIVTLSPIILACQYAAVQTSENVSELWSEHSAAMLRVDTLKNAREIPGRRTVWTAAPRKKRVETLYSKLYTNCNM